MRMGAISIPLVIAGKIVASWRDCVRCGSHYGVKWHSLPAAMLLSIGIHSMEAPGMFQAFRAPGLKNSFFR